MTPDRLLSMYGPDWRRTVVGIYLGRWTFHAINDSGRVLHTSSKTEPDLYVRRQIPEMLAFEPCRRCYGEET